MISVLSNLENAFARDDIIKVRDERLPHVVTPQGKVLLYTAFKVREDGKNKSPFENFKSCYKPKTSKVIGFNDEELYSGSILFGKKETLRVIGDDPYDIMFELKMPIQTYNTLKARSDRIVFIDTVRNPSEKDLKAMYDGETIYTPYGVRKHTIPVLRVDWAKTKIEDMVSKGDIKIGYIVNSVKRDMTEEIKKHKEKLVEEGKLILKGSKENDED